MRTIEQLRDRLLNNFAFALERPHFFGGNAFGAEHYFLTVLDNLCFIDEREKEFLALKEIQLAGSCRVRSGSPQGLLPGAPTDPDVRNKMLV